MRNVRRPTKPKILRKSGRAWTKQLLDELDRCEACGTVVSDKYFDRYNQADIKDALRKMYVGLCCYCESKIGVVEFGHIEHRMPKRTFPQSTYDWDNLHLACTYCNTKKGKKYKKSAPILDAVADIPIDSHLTYDPPRTVALTDRGKTTRDHVELDREALLSARKEVFDNAIKLIGLVNNAKGKPQADTVLDELKSLTNGQYGTLVSFAMRTYLR